MVGFGQDNKELATKVAPFLVGMTDNLDHELKLYVAAMVEGEPGEGLDLDEWPQSVVENLQKSNTAMEMLLKSKPIYPSDSEIYEIAFDGYVLYMNRSESYTMANESEVFRGRYLIVFEKSTLLDHLKDYSFADDTYPGPLTHYGVYCEDHIIDVITDDDAPVTRKLSADEIHALGFDEDGTASKGTRAAFC